MSLDRAPNCWIKSITCTAGLRHSACPRAGRTMPPRASCPRRTSGSAPTERRGRGRRAALGGTGLVRAIPQFGPELAGACNPACRTRGTPLPHLAAPDSTRAVRDAHTNPLFGLPTPRHARRLRRLRVPPPPKCRATRATGGAHHRPAPRTHASVSPHGLRHRANTYRNQWPARAALLDALSPG